MNRVDFFINISFSPLKYNILREKITFTKVILSLIALFAESFKNPNIFQKIISAVFTVCVTIVKLKHALQQDVF